MKIVIDARMYGLENAGIGRYIINLITELAKVESRHDYFLLLRRKYYHQLNFTAAHFHKVLADYPHYSFKEQFLLPGTLRRIKPDLAHFPHFNVPVFWGGRYVVTIHDLIKHYHKGSRTTTRWPLLYWLKYLNYRFLVWIAVNKSCRIITPSRFWQQKIAHLYKINRSKVKVTYEGVDALFSGMPAGRKPPFKQPYLLYTGSLYPHKNVENLVKAVMLVNRKTPLVLYIASSRNVFFERFSRYLSSLGAEKYVRLLGFVPDRKLAAVYKGATAFVFPSLMEGFGLPGLEAMAADTVLISANTSCLPEIYGQAALYFDPLNPQDMAEKINRVLADAGLRSSLIKAGRKQLSRYSWSKMARETLRIYEDCLSLRSR